MLAIQSKSTPDANGDRRVCTRSISPRPFSSGGGTWITSSKRPGRSSAPSTASSRFVAPYLMPISHLITI